MTIPPRRVPLPSDYLRNRVGDELVCAECGRKLEQPLKCPACTREELAEQPTPQDTIAEGGE